MNIVFRSSFLVCFGSCFTGRRSDNGAIEMTMTAAPTTCTELTVTTTATATAKPLCPSSNGTEKEKADVARNGSAV